MNSTSTARVRLTLYALVNGGLTLAVLGVVAHFARSPLIFPSLGPTAFLLFHDPLSPAASPRNALLGHAIGVVAAWIALLCFGLAFAQADPPGEPGWARLGAVVLALALTSGGMSLTELPHPPAGATTMIVALGMLPRAEDAAILLLGVAGMVAQGAILNRLAGLPYPLWAPASPPAQPFRR
jgi:CBS-domain-containing membrane protein